jgi:MoxR-like ATPase
MVGSQALAVLEGRHYVMPDDVQRMAVPVLAHRLILRADVQGMLPRGEQVIQQILRQVSVPVGQVGGGRG